MIIKEKVNGTLIKNKMVLKYWKKDIDRKDYVHFRNSKNKLYLHIEKVIRGGIDWDVEVRKNNITIVAKLFKNKANALKFAKSYMRKH